MGDNVSVSFSLIDNADAPSSMGKLPNDHAILVRLASLAELPSDSKDWYVSS